MRIAALTTVAVAIAAAPFMAKAIEPAMSQAEFMRAAQCYAYAALPDAGDTATAAALRARLAFAQHDQPAAVVLAARDHIRAIQTEAASEAAPAAQNARAAVCADAPLTAAMRSRAAAA